MPSVAEKEGFLPGMGVSFTRLSELSGLVGAKELWISDNIRIFLIQWEEELQELPQALESRNVSPLRKDETSTLRSLRIWSLSSPQTDNKEKSFTIYLPLCQHMISSTINIYKSSTHLNSMCLFLCFGSLYAKKKTSQVRSTSP